MGNRTLAQWQTIIEQQQASGLTIVDYCQQHDINPKSFSSRKAALKTRGMLAGEPAGGAFVRVLPDAIEKSPSTITLKAGPAALLLPGTTSPQWLANLLKAIAA